MTAERSELLDDPTSGLSDDESTDTTKSTCCGRYCEVESCDWSMPKRYVIVILLFVGMIVVNAQRVNIGVTVVTILDQVHTDGEHHAMSGSEGMTEVGVWMTSIYMYACLDDVINTFLFFQLTIVYESMF